mmetsp:Transcript_26093/g.68487  ORF Transcript_26093/g.68487 Transcript_26093/m.68487 type:complete len:252 (+) Transcript_26093:2014-2769(+)
MGAVQQPVGSTRRRWGHDGRGPGSRRGRPPQCHDGLRPRHPRDPGQPFGLPDVHRPGDRHAAGAPGRFEWRRSVRRRRRAVRRRACGRCRRVVRRRRGRVVAAQASAASGQPTRGQDADHPSVPQPRLWAGQAARPGGPALGLGAVRVSPHGVREHAGLPLGAHRLSAHRLWRRRPHLAADRLPTRGARVGRRGRGAAERGGDRVAAGRRELCWRLQDGEARNGQAPCRTVVLRSQPTRGDGRRRRLGVVC